MHVQRVHAHRTVHIGITLGQGFDIGRVVSADANAQKMPHPAITRRLQGGVQRTVVGTQIKAIKMAVGVNEHRKSPA